MNQGNWPEETVLYEATLRPHRSLSKPGFVIVMALLAVTSFIAGMAFLLMGAWPVFAFFGLDVLLVWWAFHVNYRDAKAHEYIVITGSELLVRRVTHNGVARETRFNPRWTRLDVDEDDVSGVTRVAAVSRGVSLSLGGFLPPIQKKALSKALSRALAEARR